MEIIEGEHLKRRRLRSYNIALVSNDTAITQKHSVLENPLRLKIGRRARETSAALFSENGVEVGSSQDIGAIVIAMCKKTNVVRFTIFNETL